MNRENKVYKIIEEEFDARLDVAVLTYLMDKGVEVCKQINEKQIERVKGNAIMTDSFCQALVRTAMRIASECDYFEDIFPYIAERFYKKGGKH